MKNVTVRDVYLAATKALLQFAVDQGLLSENPAKEVKVRVKRGIKEREKGFDGREAAKILAATRGPFSHLISAEMAAARRWLPWIGAYTGARIKAFLSVPMALTGYRSMVLLSEREGGETSNSFETELGRQRFGTVLCALAHLIGGHQWEAVHDSQRTSQCLPQGMIGNLSRSRAPPP